MRTICPLCNDKVDRLLYRFHLDNERQVIERIKNGHPLWTENDGACSRCVDYYQTEIVMQQRMLPEIGPYFPVKSADDFIILPSGLRLDTDPRYTGKGITICFIDSGFYLHPDIVSFRNRVKKVMDITKPDREPEFFRLPHNESWHGTMTSVVCAGDGYLSKGLYKGIACDAELVLLKVQDDTGQLHTQYIIDALQWVIDNYKEYGIRIVNISLGADRVTSYKESKIDQLAELLIKNGVTVIAASGNDEQDLINTPADSPNVITVGGIDDENNLEKESKLYHSTFGQTADGFTKPELVAHAIWIAAPVLPGTKEKKEAEILYSFLQTNDDELKSELLLNSSHTRLDERVYGSNDVTFIRQCIEQRIQTAKYISPAYMHVDGTSFAAPLVTAVVAQLLEANSTLTPLMVRQILFSTAKRIDGVAAERQGFGVIRPRKAILKTLKREIIMKPYPSPEVNARQNTISFYVQDECASQVSLAGTFNHWAQDVLLMEPGKNGIWKIEIPMLPAGRYHYKFFVDDKMWMEDIDNPYREPDGFNGFNSILVIEPQTN